MNNINNAHIKETVATPTVIVPVQPAPLINPFDLYLQREQGNDIFFEGDFLNFNGQSGKWTRRKESIGATTSFLCDMRGIALGWVKWIDGKPVDRVLGLLINGYVRPPRETLDDFAERYWPINSFGTPEDPWKKITYLPMRCKDDDENVVYGANSETALNAVRSFIAVYHRTDRGGKDPVVLLESSSFRNKANGTTYVPKFKTVGWEYWDGESPGPLQMVPEPPMPTEPPAIPPPLTDDDIADSIPF
jgi:hypothetical protein